jgi:CHAT domain-containing protein
VRYFLLIKLLLTCIFAASVTAQENNPYYYFHKGDVQKAIQLSKLQLTKDLTQIDLIDFSTALFQFCFFSTDPYCTEEGVKTLHEIDKTENLRPEVSRWINTEMQNGLAANFMHTDIYQDLLTSRKLNQLNFFKSGDGRIMNFINAQTQMANLAREQNDNVLAREVISRLVYLLSDLNSEDNNDFLKSLVLAKIVRVSMEIGDYYTAERVFKASDQYILENTWNIAPYRYEYLYASSQILANSSNKTDRLEAIKRVRLAKQIIIDGNFEDNYGKIELSMLSTIEVFMYLGSGQFALAKEALVKHPLANNSTVFSNLDIEHSHELLFMTASLIVNELTSSNVLGVKLFEKIKVEDFYNFTFRWEEWNATGSTLKAAKQISGYILSKRHTGHTNEQLLQDSLRSLLQQLEKDQALNGVITPQPAFYFNVIAEYFLTQFQDTNFEVNIYDIVALTDAINRDPSQIYTDYLSTASEKLGGDVDVRRTLSQLSSQRLQTEMDIIEAVLEAAIIPTKATDSLVTINQSIEDLFNALEEPSSLISTNDKIAYVPNTNQAFVFGFELSGAFTFLCANNASIFINKYNKNARFSDEIARIKNYLSNPNSFNLDWSKFPFESAHRLGEIFYNSEFTNCFDDDYVITFVPFGEFQGLPIEILLTQSYSGPYKSAPWALRKNSFTYANSVRQAYEEIASEKTIVMNSFLGVGNPIFDMASRDNNVAPIDSPNSHNEFGMRSINTNLISLPETEEELAYISRSFPSAKLMLEEEASEAELRNINIANYDAISFATHGVLSRELRNVREPGLVLTKTDANSDQYMSSSIDGILTAEEISKLRLNAEIVTLSACNTATVDVSSSSLNIKNLASAFKLAGVKNIVSTLWSVESTASVKINQSIFDNWIGKDIPLSHAVRTAKIQYIDVAEELKAAPIFWGAHVLVGPGRNKSIFGLDRNTEVDLFTLKGDGIVTGVSILSPNKILTTKGVVTDKTKLSPAIELLTLNSPDVHTTFNLLEDRGGALIKQTLDRNLIIQGSYLYENEHAGISPKFIELNASGARVWEYQYPIADKTIVQAFDVTALKNGNTFSLLHVNEDDGSDYGRTKLIGLFLSPDGKVVAEKELFSTSNYMPFSTSLALETNVVGGALAVFVNYLKVGHKELMKGDLGDPFICSEADTVVFYLSLANGDNFAPFASTTIKNFWAYDAMTADDEIYLSGATSRECRFDVTQGGWAQIGRLNVLDFELLYEDKLHYPSYIADVEKADQQIKFAQVWKPSIAGTSRKSLDQVLQEVKNSWDPLNRSEHQDSMHPYLLSGSLLNGTLNDIRIVSAPDFTIEGARISKGSGIFFGKQGSKPAILKVTLN